VVRWFQGNTDHRRAGLMSRRRSVCTEAFRSRDLVNLSYRQLGCPVRVWLTWSAIDIELALALALAG
jgi:hypothetical protein